MEMLKAVVFTTLLTGFSSLGYAAECDTRNIPASLGKLIEEEKYDEAVAQAKAAYEKQAKSKVATLNLAKVYVNATLHSGLSVDISKLGFKHGESGKKQLTKQQLKAATRSSLVVNQKYFEEADAFIQKTVKIWPEEKSLLYCLTKIHFHNRDHGRFLKSLHRTAEVHKDSQEETVNFLLTYGVKLFHNRRYDLATDVYETLLKTFPESVPVISSLGTAYIERGHTKKAMTYYDKARKIAPDDKIVVSNIAMAAMLLKDFKKAEKFHKLKAMDEPNLAENYFDLAINAMSVGPKHSLPYWKKYFEINAKYPDNKAWSDNAKAIQQAINDNNDSAYHWFDEGARMIKSQTPKYAVALMSYARNKHPYDASISYGLAQAYHSGRHYDLEEESLLETLKNMRHPKNTFKKDKSGIYYKLSLCSYKLERLDDTEAYLKKVKADSKDAANADYLYGLVYQVRGDKEKAQGYFKSCIKKAKGGRVKEYCERLVTMDIPQ